MADATTARPPQLSPISQLALRIAKEKYRPTKEEYLGLIKYKNTLADGLALGAFAGLVAGFITTRKLKMGTRVLSCFGASLCGGTYMQSRFMDSGIYNLMNIKNSALSGELLIIMQQNFPGHPALRLWLKRNKNEMEMKIDDNPEDEDVPYKPLRRIRSYSNHHPAPTPSGSLDRNDMDSYHAEVAALHRRFGVPVVQPASNSNQSSGGIPETDDALLDPWALFEVGNEQDDAKKKKKLEKRRKLGIHERRSLNREKFLKWEQKRSSLGQQQQQQKQKMSSSVITS